MRKFELYTLSRQGVWKGDRAAHKVKVGGLKSPIKIITDEWKFDCGRVDPYLMSSPRDRIGRVDVAVDSTYSCLMRVAEASSRALTTMRRSDPQHRMFG